MLKLISFGSSSKGNCHLLYNGNTSIMLDCGINFSHKTHLVEPYNCCGIIITHKHNDHIKGIKEGSYLGNQKIYGNESVIKDLEDVLDLRKVTLQEMKKYKIGDDWEILPISVLHDVPNFSYVIHDKKTGLNILYATDLGYSENLKIKGINVWIIECNHIRSEIERKYQKSLEERNSNVAYYKRVLSDKGHLSMEDSANLINNNISNTMKSILLCHISSSESDYKRFETKYRELLSNKVKCPIKALNNKINDFEEYDIFKHNSKLDDISLLD